MEESQILTYKSIINPFKIKSKTKITEKHILHLKEWASMKFCVWASVRASIRYSIGDSVWESVQSYIKSHVCESVVDSTWDSVWESIRTSTRTSVMSPIGDSIWVSVHSSVSDSVWAYTGSFFKLEKWIYPKIFKIKGYPFQSAVYLWEQGLVPSFDGTTWRLHSGKNAKIVYEIKETELKKWKMK